MLFNNLLPDHNLFGSSFRCFFKASKNGMVGVRLTQKEAVDLFFSGEEIYDQSSGWNTKYDKESTYRRRLLLTESRDTATNSEMIEVDENGVLYQWYVEYNGGRTARQVIES